MPTFTNKTTGKAYTFTPKSKGMKMPFNRVASAYQTALDKQRQMT